MEKQYIGKQASLAFHNNDSDQKLAKILLKSFLTLPFLYLYQPPEYVK